MGKKCVAMLLAGGQGSRLGVLTKNMAKPAVAFGGKYRIIDFPLSNCSNSGIDVVGVLTQYQPLELNSYIGNGMPWDLDRLTGGVFVLPPYMKGKSGTWYKGTANAIYQNMTFIQQYDPDYVLVLSGDHIYKMDYSAMIAMHEKKHADCTIAVYSVPWNEASRFGIMNTNEEGDIVEFEEKPANPKSNNASMGIYVFNWKDVGTIESLWEANMDLLQSPPAFNLYDSAWRIYARNPTLPPHYIAKTAEVSDSMVTEGCTVAGKVDHSILFSGATVEEGAIVENSVIMNGARICKGARIRRAIVSENAVVGPDSVVGGNGRIAVVGQETVLPEYSVVKPGEQIDMEVLAKREAKAEEDAK